MKEVFREFFEILAYSFIIGVLLLGGFLLFINLYHYKTISNTTIINYDTNKTHSEVLKKVSEVSEKIQQINKATYKNMDDAVYYKNIAIHLNRCNEYMKGSAYYTSKGEKNLGIVDVYNEANYYYYTFYGQCLVKELTAISELSKNKVGNKVELSGALDIAKKQLYNDGDYVIQNLLSSSSYSYVTENSQSAIYNQNIESYNLLANNYLNSIKIIDLIATDTLNSVREAA